MQSNSCLKINETSKLKQGRFFFAAKLQNLDNNSRRFRGKAVCRIAHNRVHVFFDFLLIQVQSLSTRSQHAVGGARQSALKQFPTGRHFRR